MVKSTRMKSILTFFRDVQTEMKKVTWPTREETTQMTVVVIIATVITGVYVGGIDYVLTKVLATLL